MKVGIPKGLLYYRNKHLWDVFFRELGIELVYSDDTNKEILNKGVNLAIDECCLSFKIFLGHVESLIGRCDYILIPRIGVLEEKEIVCTKFQALYDLVNNIFRDRDVKFIDLNVDFSTKDSEYKAFRKLGKKLKMRKFNILRAYFMAKQAELMYHNEEVKKQEALLDEDKIKVLIVGHAYNVYDKLIGVPILDYLKSIDVIPVTADITRRQEAKRKAKKISPTLKWAYNKELLGTVDLYKDRVDGIILVTAFPCGPDSLVNDIIIRRIKDKPIITLIVDGGEGTAGMETRLESFIDIITLKKEGSYEK